jgi:hypothetical protein
MINDFISANWPYLMREALDRNAGHLLPGLVHNLHNYAHSFSMQMEMWDMALEKNPNCPFSGQQRSLQRMTNSCSDFATECSILSQRSRYTEFEPTFISFASALDWIKSFWKHNLFFKHFVHLEIVFGDSIPDGVTLRPGGFIYALEEGLKNALESMNIRKKEVGVFVLHLDVMAEKECINFALRSPTALDQSIDPWQAGSSTKPGHLGFGLPLLRIGCREMGWYCRLTGDDRSTVLSFAVPRT